MPFDVQGVDQRIIAYDQQHAEYWNLKPAEVTAAVRPTQINRILATVARAEPPRTDLMHALGVTILMIAVLVVAVLAFGYYNEKNSKNRRARGLNFTQPGRKY